MKKKRILSFIAVFVVLSGSLFALSIGDRVLGRWSDGYYYPATVVSIKGVSAELDYDDGDNAVVPAAQVKSITWKVGTKLECNFQNAGRYYPGTITQKNGDSIHIDYDDGDKEDTTIGHCRSK